MQSSPVVMGPFTALCLLLLQEQSANAAKAAKMINLFILYLFDGNVIAKLREDIFDEFLKTDYDGLIFTYVWAFDMKSDWDYIKHVTDKFLATGGEIYYVELVADRSVRLKRNKTENRLLNKASKRDLKASEERMLREERNYRVVSKDGEIPFKNYIKIDNSNLSASEVALMIKKHFNLKDAR